jgi:hypothetical protein
MSVEIPTRVEARRGCGWRKPGGLYLLAGKPSEPCTLLPVALQVCPTCGEGIKPARSWTWVDADELLGLPLGHPDSTPAEHAPFCPLSRLLGRAGLLWIGEAFYATPRAFMEEAARMGISRRITAVPRDFQRGRTWVLCAHRSAIAPTEPAGHPTAAVFTLFRPTAVEYVVRGDESETELQRLVERGIQPVRVERAEPTLDGMDTPA